VSDVRVLARVREGLSVPWHGGVREAPTTWPHAKSCSRRTAEAPDSDLHFGLDPHRRPGTPARPRRVLAQTATGAAGTGGTVGPPGDMATVGCRRWKKELGGVRPAARAGGGAGEAGGSGRAHRIRPHCCSRARRTSKTAAASSRPAARAREARFGQRGVLRGRGRPRTPGPSPGGGANRGRRPAVPAAAVNVVSASCAMGRRAGFDGQRGSARRRMETLGDRAQGDAA